VANSTYPDSDDTLAAPLGEAKRIGNALRARNYVVEQVDNATKSALQASIERFVSAVRPGAPVLIFFAGYGLQVDHKNYIVPTDARIWKESDVVRDGVAVSDILARAGEKNAGERMVVLDAARRNPFERRFRSYSAGLAPANPAEKDLFVYSVGPGAVLSSAAGEGEAFGVEIAAAIRKQNVSALQAFEAARDVLAKKSDNHAVPAIFAGTDVKFSFDPNATLAPAAAGTSPGKNTEKTKPVVDVAVAEKRSEPLVPVKPVETAAPRKQDDAGRPYSEADGKRKAWLESQIASNAKDAQALFDHGVMLAQHGDYAQALADFDRVVEIEPDNPKALNNSCWLRAIRNELQKAAAACDALLKTFAETLDSRALIHLKLGEYTLAIQDYSEAIRMKDSFASALYGRGIAKLRSGDQVGAEKDFQAALASDPHIEQEYISYGLR
jgi:tetratricopeptide (TPR) repeat protein